MPRTVVVLEVRFRLVPGHRDRCRRLTARLAQRFRFMPDSAERIGRDVVEIPFPRRRDIHEARREVALVLDSIDPDWRRYCRMVSGD
jgi:hypothetical protein